MIRQRVDLSVEVGDESPVVAHLLTLTDLVKYAGASGDFHPLHHDQAAAIAMGLPGVIGHGMFSAGVLARAITDFVGIENLTHLAFRFLSPTRLGELLTTSVKVVARLRTAEADTIDLDCRLANSSGDVKVTARAQANVGRVASGQSL